MTISERSIQYQSHRIVKRLDKAALGRTFAKSEFVKTTTESSLFKLSEKTAQPNISKAQGITDQLQAGLN